MKLRAIALIAFLFVLPVAANAQATRADLPALDNFLGIATFPLWDGDAPEALGKEQADVPSNRNALFMSAASPYVLKLQAYAESLFMPSRFISSTVYRPYSVMHSA